MSESDESGGDESLPDSGSDWSEAGKEAAAEAAEAAAEDDDVSMAGDSDNSPGSADARKKDGASRKRRKPSPHKVLSKFATRRNRDSFATAPACLCLRLTKLSGGRQIAVISLST